MERLEIIPTDTFEYSLEQIERKQEERKNKENKENKEEEKEQKEQKEEKEELNNFEKILQNKIKLNEIIQTQDNILSQIKNIQKEEQEEQDNKDNKNERNLPEIDNNNLNNLKTIYEINETNIIFINNYNSSFFNSFQACLGMIFGYKLEELQETSSKRNLPNLDPNSSSFDSELNQWLLSNTNCQALRLTTEEMCDTQIPVKSGALCIILGKTESNPENHCFLCYVEDSILSQVTTVRCILDPLDHSSLINSSNIQDNIISLMNIDWIMYFLDLTNQIQDQTSNISHHSEILSIEEQGLFTQDESINEPTTEPISIKTIPTTLTLTSSLTSSSSSKSDIKLGQSTCETLSEDMEITNSIETNNVNTNTNPNIDIESNSNLPVSLPSSTNQIRLGFSQTQTTDFPGNITTTIAPLYTDTLTEFNEFTQPESIKKFTPAISPFEVHPEIVSTPTTPKKKILLGFSQTQHYDILSNNSNNHGNNSNNDNGNNKNNNNSSNAPLNDSNSPFKRLIEFDTVSFPPQDPNVLSLNYTQTQLASQQMSNSEDSLFQAMMKSVGHDSTLNSHIKSNTTTTTTTTTKNNTNHNYEEKVGDSFILSNLSDDNSYILPENISDNSNHNDQGSQLKSTASIETVPSIQSRRKIPSVQYISSSNTESSDLSQSIPSSHNIIHDQNSSEGWVTSNKIPQQSKEKHYISKNNNIELKNINDLVTQSSTEEKIQSIDEVEKMKYSEILQLLQQKEKELKEREEYIKRKEEEMKQSIPPVDVSNQSNITNQTNQSNQISVNENIQGNLTQGSIFAVDSLLQLKKSNMSNNQDSNHSEERFQWSSLKTIPKDTNQSEDPSPTKISRFNRRKSKESNGSIVNQNNKKDVYDFNPSSSEDENDDDHEKDDDEEECPSPQAPKKTSFVSKVIKTNNNNNNNNNKMQVINLESQEIEWNSQDDISKLLKKNEKQNNNNNNSNNKNGDNDEGGKLTRNDTNLSVIEAELDIPSSLLFEDLDYLTWKQTWKELEKFGWFWQKGRGLINFVYCRPKANYSLSIGKEGIDYFTHENDVLNYVRKNSLAPKSKKNTSTTTTTTVKNPSLKTSYSQSSIDEQNSQSQQKRVIKKREQNDSTSNIKSSEQHSKNSNNRRLSKELQTTQDDHADDEGGEDNYDNNNDDDDEDDEDNNKQEKEKKEAFFDWRKEIETLPWSELWRNLQLEGWTWAHGSGLVTTWYLKPGIEKFNKSLVGDSIFGSQEEVRQYVLLLNNDNNNNNNNSNNNNNNNGKNTNIKNDQSDSDYYDESGIRKKRKLRPKINIAYDYYTLGNKKRDSFTSDDNRNAKKSRHEKESESKHLTPKQTLSNSYSADSDEREVCDLDSDSEDHISSRNNHKSHHSHSHLQQRNQTNKNHNKSNNNNNNNNNNKDSNFARNKQDSLVLTPNPSKMNQKSTNNSNNNNNNKNNSNNNLSKSTSPNHSNYISRLTSNNKVMTPDSSSSGQSNKRRRSEGNSKLFSKYKFFLTGIDNSFHISREDLERDIQSNGGIIVDFPTLQKLIRKNVPKDSILVIACPTGFRRPNFLYSLAAGLQPIHPQWIIDSIASEWRVALPIDAYILPSGSSVIHPYFGFRKNISTTGVFNQIRILCFANPVWNDIIRASDGIICDASPENVGKYRNGLIMSQSTPSKTQKAKSSSGFGVPIILPDYIIVDSYSYANGDLDPLQSDLIQQCESYLNSREIKSHISIPKVVSTEWAAHCLGIGELIDSTSNEIFTLPSDPSHKPIAYKGSDRDGGGRYVVGDVVFFEISNKNNNNNNNNSSINNNSSFSLCHQRRLKHKGIQKPLMIGKIISFSRKGINTPVQVKIRPLRINCRLCDENMNDSDEIFLNKRRNHTYELSLDQETPDRILSTEMLRHYPVILSSQVFEQIAYAETDFSVYMSSEEWELLANDVTDSECSQQDYNKSRQKSTHHAVQQSQDY